jgi:hypothetical protein
MIILRSYGWTSMDSETKKYLYKKYMSDFLAMDNNFIETIGT